MRLVALHRFPVKSMQGEPLEAAPLRWTGIAGDRQYAFVRDANRSWFPWLTGRELPDLVRHRPRFVDPDDPRSAALMVRDPAGEERPVEDPLWIDRFGAAAGEPVRLIQLNRGCFDALPVSVITTATHTRLDQEHGRPLEPLRFRINVLIEGGDEREWLGRSLVFGTGPEAPRLRVADRIQRCAMVTIDPGTAERDASVMRTVAQRFDNQIGVYCSVERLGTLRIGDTVEVAG